MMSPPTNIFKRKAATGFSLVELMVALFISLLLMGSVILVFTANKRSYSSQNQTARIQESGRFAINLLVKDLRMAGYWGGYVNALTEVVGVTASADCALTAAYGKAITQPVFGVNNTNNDAGPLNSNYSTCIPNASYAAGTDILVVRRADPSLATPNSGLNFFVTDIGTAQFYTHSGSATFRPPRTLNSSTVHHARTHIYFVGPGNISCPTGPNAGVNNTNSLWRLSFNADGPDGAAQELFGPVEDFQVQYGEDTTGDNTTDVFRNANSVAVANWANITAVRVSLLMRAACIEDGLDSVTVPALADSATAYGNDNIRRQLYTATVKIRNK